MPVAMAEQHDFGRLLATLRASWGLIAVLVVVAAVGAYVVSLATPSRYRSAETLIYLPAGGTTAIDSDTATRDLQTAVGLVQAAPVLGPAAAEASACSRTSWSSVTAALPTDSNLIRIDATAASASDAQKRALMVAKVFQQFRLSLQRRAIDARINSINTQINRSSRGPPATPRRRSATCATSCRWHSPTARSRTATSPSAIPRACRHRPSSRSPRATSCWAPSRVS